MSFNRDFLSKRQTDILHKANNILTERKTLDKYYLRCAMAGICEKCGGELSPMFETGGVVYRCKDCGKKPGEA